MKKRIVAILLMLSTTSAHATYREVTEVAKICQMLSEIGQGIMAMRQGGHTEQEVRSRGPTDGVVDTLINVAFSIPLAEDAKQRVALTSSFKRDVYISCLENAAEQ